MPRVSNHRQRVGSARVATARDDPGGRMAAPLECAGEGRRPSSLGAAPAARRSFSDAAAPRGGTQRSRGEAPAAPPLQGGGTPLENSCAGATLRVCRGRGTGCVRTLRMAVAADPPRGQSDTASPGE